MEEELEFIYPPWAKDMFLEYIKQRPRLEKFLNKDSRMEGANAVFYMLCEYIPEYNELKEKWEDGE